MLMTDGEIREALKEGKLIVEGFDEKQLEPSSYDMRVGKEGLISGQDERVLLDQGASLTLKPGEFGLVLTYESVKLQNTIAGQIGMRSWLARKGLILLAGMQIDPGFEGVLRLGLYNASPRRITLDYKDPICTVEFHQLSVPVLKPHPGVPALARGVLPEDDKNYLRTLETASLSDLGSAVKVMTTNVSALATDVSSLTTQVGSLAQEMSMVARFVWRVVLPLLLIILGAVVAGFFAR